MTFKVSDDHNFFADFDQAYIAPPEKLPWYIKIAAWLTKRAVKKDLMIPKLLAWCPKVAISSGVMESLVAHDDEEISARMLKIIRVQVSVSVACPFCIDMNAFEFEKAGLSLAEIEALREGKECARFSEKERLMMEYVSRITATPVLLPKELVERMRASFSPRGIVLIAATASQVNYWARLIRSLGVPVAGFGEVCKLER